MITQMFNVCNLDQNHTTETLTLANQSEVAIKHFKSVACFSSLEVKSNYFMIPFAVAAIKDKILWAPFIEKYNPNINIQYFLPWIANNLSIIKLNLLPLPHWLKRISLSFHLFTILSPKTKLYQTQHWTKFTLSLRNTNLFCSKLKLFHFSLNYPKFFFCYEWNVFYYGNVI